jgi:hypothetical protein
MLHIEKLKNKGSKHLENIIQHTQFRILAARFIVTRHVNELARAVNVIGTQGRENKERTRTIMIQI